MHRGRRIQSNLAYFNTFPPCFPLSVPFGLTVLDCLHLCIYLFQGLLLLLLHQPLVFWVNFVHYQDFLSCYRDLLFCFAEFHLRFSRSCDTFGFGNLLLRRIWRFSLINFFLLEIFLPSHWNVLDIRIWFFLFGTQTFVHIQTILMDLLTFTCISQNSSGLFNQSSTLNPFPPFALVFWSLCLIWLARIVFLDVDLHNLGEYSEFSTFLAHQ